MQERPIQFYFRGAIEHIDGLPPTHTVLRYLRETGRSTGTKEGCNEGDCGACTVMLGERDDAAPGGLRLSAVNACLLLVPMLDGKALFTIEDLAGIAGGGLHPVQQALVDGHGSQCGFCTPGFAMSLFARYERSPDCPDRAQAAEAIAGNLCRCTGYRPIVDALPAAFALPPARLDRAPVRAALDRLAALPALDYHAGGGHFCAPRGLDELAAVRLARPEARLVAGATDLGLIVTKQLRDPGPLISVGAVDALGTITHDAAGLTLGAGARLADAFAALVAFDPGWTEIARRFAGPPIRNAGTVGGNLANASPIGDLMPGLIALGARIVLRRGDILRRLALEDFYLAYQRTALTPGEFILAVELPPSPPGRLFRSWKIARRKDQDISALCGAFAIVVDRGRVDDARIAFGGMAATPRRATATETCLLGETWDAATVARAAAVLAAEFTPLDDLRASAAYRARVAANLLRRLWLAQQGTPVDLAALEPTP